MPLEFAEIAQISLKGIMEKPCSVCSGRLGILQGVAPHLGR